MNCKLNQTTITHSDFKESIAIQWNFDFQIIGESHVHKVIFDFPYNQTIYGINYVSRLSKKL